MKFRFYITDLNGCGVEGTDSEEEAKNFSLCEDYIVVDTELGVWLSSSGENLDVQEA